MVCHYKFSCFVVFHAKNFRCVFLGRYAVDVKYDDKPVPNSPFRVRAGPPYDASKVKVSGPGVAKTGIVAEEVTKAVVDTTEAGVADLSGSSSLIMLTK